MTTAEHTQNQLDAVSIVADLHVADVLRMGHMDADAIWADPDPTNTFSDSDLPRLPGIDPSEVRDLLASAIKIAAEVA